jgi:Pentapeptide repeats (8 copies)
VEGDAMKFEIKSRLDSSVLFSVETDTWKLAIEAAVKSGADLSGADLSGADLSRADLSGADLSRANLSGADLSGANLSGANLSRANLSGADLSGADLSRADLSRANLSGANGIDKFPIQVLGHKHALSTTADGKLRIGCHVHSFDDWFLHAEEIGAAEGYSAIDVEIYKLHIQHIAMVSRLLWAKKKEVAA